MILPRFFGKFCQVVSLTFLVFPGIRAQQALDSIVTYTYRMNGDSVRAIKIDNEFNAAGQPTAHSIYSWNPSRKKWEGTSFPCEECYPMAGRVEYEYYDQGLLLVTKRFGWGGVPIGWVVVTKSESTFDRNGNLVNRQHAFWNNPVNDWIPDMAEEFGFDESGRKISSLVYRWIPETGSWLSFDHYEWNYDQYGRELTENRFSWDTTSSDWSDYLRREWSYDSTGLVIQIASYQWAPSGTGYVWKPAGMQMFVNVKDTMGNLIGATMLDGSPNHWRILQREEYSYDTSGRMVLYILSKYPSILEERLRTEREYDEGSRLVRETSTGYMNRREGFEIQNKHQVMRAFDRYGDVSIADWFYWDGESRSYLPEGKDYYFYHSTATGHEETAIDRISVYPNPTTGMVTLSGLSGPAEVLVYSMQGVLLRSDPQVEGSFDISGLLPGAYLIMVKRTGCPPFRTMIIKE